MFGGVIHDDVELLVTQPRIWNYGECSSKKRWLVLMVNRDLTRLNTGYHNCEHEWWEIVRSIWLRWTNIFLLLLYSSYNSPAEFQVTQDNIMEIDRDDGPHGGDNDLYQLRLTLWYQSVNWWKFNTLWNGNFMK